jgi:hypothetical protein
VLNERDIGGRTEVEEDAVRGVFPGLCTVGEVLGEGVNISGLI